MSRVVWLVWVLVALAAVLTVLAVVLDEEILRAYEDAGATPDSAVAAPSFTPVIVVLDVVITGQVLVLLAFLLGGHDWARHCLAVTFALLAVSTAALLRTGPPVPFAVLSAVWLVVALVLLALLYRPGMASHVLPRVAQDADPVVVARP